MSANYSIGFILLVMFVYDIHLSFVTAFFTPSSPSLSFQYHPIYPIPLYPAPLSASRFSTTQRSSFARLSRMHNPRSSDGVSSKSRLFFFFGLSSLLRFCASGFLVPYREKGRKANYCFTTHPLSQSNPIPLMFFNISSVSSNTTTHSLPVSLFIVYNTAASRGRNLGPLSFPHSISTLCMHAFFFSSSFHSFLFSLVAWTPGCVFVLIF
ncbi:unnamed protein product [Somion occarium]|uniref:Uncharacterized protein n=1 Tax=Somion occarium TaxID=3059160 RepID=A0ABP1DLY9_9APHY